MRIVDAQIEVNVPRREPMDITLLRILLKQLCKQSIGDAAGISAKAVFDWGSAPGYDEQRDTVRAYHELLVSKELATVERIRSTYPHHADFAVLMPTQLGRIWCRYAYDDQEWERHAEELRSLLMT